jgi:phage terminase large subunit-like protein
MLACKWVKLACARHLADLDAARQPSYRFRFDHAKANRVCDFIEGLPHVKGHWAAKREEIRLEHWQCFILCSIFGWVWRDSGLRRFREAYICVPRKNAKSTTAGGIGIYMFAADGESGSEVYSGATSKKQAWEVFRPAKQMVERTPDLKEALDIFVGAENLAILADGSRFEPVIGKPGDGASPHCGIVDEYHEHDTDSLVDTFRTGMGARLQPLLLIITTAGDNIGGPCKAAQENVEKVLAGTLDRDELFGIVYTIDEGDDWTSEEALRKANPNFGVSVFGDFLLTQQRNAVTDARKQGIFRTKHLNVWVGSNLAYINIQRWNELADTTLRPEHFIGLPCTMASDFASKKDIAARVMVFRKSIAVDATDKRKGAKDHFYVFGRYYLPESRARLPEFQHYQAWVTGGFLRTTPGNVIDYDVITNESIEDVRRFRVKEVCFDPWNAEQYAQTVAAKTPAIAVEIPQQVRFLSEPMKQLDALVTDGRLHHDGNPALSWMIANLTGHEDAKENIFPRKARAESKIDGAVALIMALSRALVSETGKYTDPRVLSV